MRDWLRDKLLPAVLLAVIGAAIHMYMEVELLRVQVDRLEVYVQQLWDQKR